MKKIERRALLCKLLALLLSAGLLVFVVRWCVSGGRWAAASFNRHLYNSAGQLASGSVLDRDGDVLSWAENGERKCYDGETVRKATLHTVGDLRGSVATGVLKTYADALTGYSLLNGAYGAEQGRALSLTIDAYYNYVAYQALNGRKGAVAVYNYQTGEILCMVSTPSYDPLHVPEDIETNERYEGAYLNRVLSATFTPGSVFKTVTLAAALETIPDAESRVYHCDGSVVIGGETIVCSGTHGDQSLEEAFAHSCNVAFGQLAAELGGETLQCYAEKAGLTASYSVSTVDTARGRFDLTGLDEGQLAWSGVGQGNDLVNPCAMMVWMGAIANGGKAAVPYYAERTVDFLGIPHSLHHSAKTDRLVSADTAARLTELMANNVDVTYGASRFPNMDLCAKSGTAEVGDGKSPHAWFVGFLRNEDAPYAFAVLVENGGGGSSVAGSVAAKVLDPIVNGY